MLWALELWLGLPELYCEEQKMFAWLAFFILDRCHNNLLIVWKVWNVAMVAPLET